MNLIGEVMIMTKAEWKLFMKTTYKTMCAEWREERLERRIERGKELRKARKKARKAR